MKEPYLYLEGIKKLAESLRGDEVIHMGIRPYGFHAGNALAMVIYPILLCEECERLGKKVKFSFFVSLNDYEQDELDGPDYHRFPFNIHPKRTILKFVQDPSGCCDNIVDHYTPIIKDSVMLIKKTYPTVNIKFYETSRVKNNHYFKDYLLRTIENPLEQLSLYKKHTGREILNNPVFYANAVCPKCKSANGDIFIEKQKIHLKCKECSIISEGSYGEFDYWWYHKPMLVARYKIFNIEVSLSGGDHYSEGDFVIRNAFIKLFNSGLKSPKTFFSPMLLGLDERRMSKSQGNASYPKLDKLYKLAKQDYNYSLTATKDLVFNELGEDEYREHLRKIKL